jgi:hypothetical protein
MYIFDFDVKCTLITVISPFFFFLPLMLSKDLLEIMKRELFFFPEFVEPPRDCIIWGSKTEIDVMRTWTVTASTK